MKRLFTALAAACFVLFTLAVSIKPAIIFFTKKQLANVFIQSQVSIKGCVIRPSRGLTLSGIEIKRSGAYNINIKEAAVRYDLLSILKAGSLKLSLKDISVRINAPSKMAQELAGYVKLKTGRSPFGSMEVSNLSLDLKTKDAAAKAVLSADLNPAKQTLERLDFKMESFEMLNAKVSNLSLNLDSGQGEFNIGKLSYDKAALTAAKGRISLQGTRLLLSGLNASTINGRIEGDIGVDFAKSPRYLVDLKCTSLALENLIRDFKLQDKFDMTGRLSGSLTLEGEGAKIKALGGDFSTLAPGGTLVITDTRAVEGVIKASRQPADLLVESLKNYRYNTGVMTLGIENDTIVLKIRLEGDAGKRSLDVAFHGLNF